MILLQKVENDITAKSRNYITAKVEMILLQKQK